jgi:hypothetical protein
MAFEPGRIPEGAKPFKDGQSGNPAGRPPKTVKSVISELLANGHEPVKAPDVRAIIEAMLALPIEEVSRLVTDDKQPAIIRITGRRLLDKSKGFEGLQTLLDRAHGKATQPTDLQSGGQPIMFETKVVKNRPLPTDD